MTLTVEQCWTRLWKHLVGSFIHIPSWTAAKCVWDMNTLLYWDHECGGGSLTHVNVFDIQSFPYTPQHTRTQASDICTEIVNPLMGWSVEKYSVFLLVCLSVTGKISHTMVLEYSTLIDYMHGYRGYLCIGCRCPLNNLCWLSMCILDYMLQYSVFDLAKMRKYAGKWNLNSNVPTWSVLDLGRPPQSVYLWFCNYTEKLGQNKETQVS